MSEFQSPRNALKPALFSIRIQYHVLCINELKLLFLPVIITSSFEPLLYSAPHRLYRSQSLAILLPCHFLTSISCFSVLVKVFSALSIIQLSTVCDKVQGTVLSSCTCHDKWHHWHCVAMVPSQRITTWPKHTWNKPLPLLISGRFYVDSSTWPSVS